MSQKLADLILDNQTSAALAELDKKRTQRNINDQFKYDSGCDPATCLFIACREGNETLVSKILGIKGVDVNKGDSKSVTPLHIATRRHQTSVTELLLQVNEILCKGNDEGHTPIHEAADKGYDDILTLLLDKFPSEINCQSNDQAIPLHYSVYNGHLSTTSVLLQRGAQCLGNKDGVNPIYIGAQEGYDEIVKQLLEHFPDKINVQNNEGETPLLKSVYNGHLSTTSVLLQRGAQCLVDKDGVNPIYIGAQEGYDEIAEQLLEHFPAKIDVQNNDGLTPLHRSVYNDHLSTMSVLLQHGAQCLGDEDGVNPIYTGALKGYDEIVKKLLEHFPDKIDVQNNQGATPLHWSVYSGHLSTTSVLLQHGAQCLVDKNGNNPIHNGALKRYDEIVKKLLEHFPDKINVQNNKGETPLDWSVSNGHLSTTSVLLQHGAQCLVDANGNNPIHYGAQKGYDEIVKQLLEYFPDKINVQNNEGNTPLHYSVYNGHLSTTTVLLQRGAQCLGDEDGDNPIYIGAQKGYDEIVKQLLEHFPDKINVQNNEGHTPLHWSVYYGRTSVSKLLIDSGANVNIKDKDSLTPLDIAKQKGNQEIIELLSASQPADKSAKIEENKGKVLVKEDKVSETGNKKETPDNESQQKNSKEVAGTKGISETKPPDKGKKKASRSKDVLSQQIREDLKNLLGQENIKKNWGHNEKLNLVATCVLRMFLGGKYCYGKTSLARSLLLNAGVITEEEERTEVLEFNPWKIDKDTTVTLYDLGGHQCYQHLCHLFHCNSPNNLTLLPHQINDTDYSTTCSWINDVISRSPKSFIHFILTKSDLVPKEQQDQLKDDFKNHITEFLEKEIKALSKKLRRVQKRNLTSASNGEFLKEIKEKYELLVKQLKEEEILDVVSCKTSQGLSEFRSKLINLIKSGEFKIEMPETAYLLYQQLGRLGIEGVKQRKTITSKKPPVSDLKQKSDTAISRKETIAEKRDVIPKTKDTVSMKTKDQIPMIAEEKENLLTPLNVKITSKSELMKDESLQYVTFEDAKKELIKLLPTNLPDAEVEHKLKHYLQFFHSNGLLLWHNTEQLNKFIFNDLFSFIQMLKTLFHHSFLASSEDDTGEKQESSFDFNRLSAEQQDFLEDENITETKYNQLLEKLKEEGVFSVLLLNILAIKFNFEAHLGTLMHILEHLGIAYSILSEADGPDIHTQKLFFPWYLTQSTVPEDIHIALSEMKKDANDHFKLKVSIVGLFPSAFFNCFAVRIYNHLVPKRGTQTRKMWPNHIFACINKNLVYLEYLKNSNNDRIDIYATSPLSVTAMRESWKFVENCLKVINSLNSEWWGGLSRDQYLECLHCIIQLGKGVAKFKPYRWNIVEHLEEECSKEMVCHCQLSKLHEIPAALLYPLPQDDNEAQECVLEAAKYMNKHVQNSSSQSHITIQDVSDETLDALSERIEHFWQKIGSSLDLKARVLSEIKRQSRSEYEGARKMLDIWRQKGGDAKQLRSVVEEHLGTFVVTDIYWNHTAHYSVKHPSHRPYGRGLVVICALFLGDLKDNHIFHIISGYSKDIIAIETFFSKTLKYEVQIYKDTCKAEFMNKMKEVQSELNSSKNYDRFLLFVLSHGNESGISMCQRGKDNIAEKEGGRNVTISLSSITRLFHHDMVPAMKNFPKCFIVQTCQGSEVCKAASTAEEDTLEFSIAEGPEPSLEISHGKYQKEMVDETNKIALGSDILECFACCPNTQSWVGENGSVYVKHFLKVLRENYQHRDFCHILTEVNENISQTRIKAMIGGKIEEAYQMPTFRSSLTKAFVFRLPTEHFDPKIVNKLKTSQACLIL